VRISINGYLGRVTSLTIVSPRESRAVDSHEHSVLGEAGAGARWSVSTAPGAGPGLRCTVSVEGRERTFTARALRIEARESGLLRVTAGRAERVYPAVIEIQPGTKGWTVINEAPIEMYLGGVVAAEVSPRWHPEALKAFTVAARSYTERNRGRHGAQFDLCDTTHCHCYAGIAKVGDTIRAAVGATAGIVAMHDGKPIDAVYSADCGGRTQTVQDAWGSKREIGYLRSVVDAPEGGGSEFCAVNPNHAWSFTLSLAELERMLNRSPETRIGTLKRVEVVGTTGSGRPAMLEAIGGDVELFPVSERLPCEMAEERPRSRPMAAGSRTQTAPPLVVRQVPISQFRRLLGEARLKGSMLELQVLPDGGLHVQGKGNGHGVGLCQYGAQGMAARQAKGWQAIVQHYYTGVTLGVAPVVARRPEGFVRDVATGRPVSGVRIRALGSPAIALTGADGRFVLPADTATRADFEVRAPSSTRRFASVRVDATRPLVFLVQERAGGSVVSLSK
jgi:SpoIID/LytB domain protein